MAIPKHNSPKRIPKRARSDELMSEQDAAIRVLVSHDIAHVKATEQLKASIKETLLMKGTIRVEFRHARTIFDTDIETKYPIKVEETKVDGPQDMIDAILAAHLSVGFLPILSTKVTMEK